MARPEGGPEETSPSPADQVEAYRELEPLCQSFGLRLLDLFAVLFEEAGVNPWYSYNWTNDSQWFANLLNRVRREGRALPNRVEDFPEVAGVAFVGYTPSDVNLIANVVESEFDVDYELSTPPAIAFEQTERNLSSDPPIPRYPHTTYYARLSEERRVLPEWRAYSELRTQVHVLTMAQYAWWCVDTQGLPFYWPSSYTPPGRAILARWTGILRAADEALATAEATRADTERAYEEAIAGGELEFPLDGGALIVYLRLSEPLAELATVAEAEGLRPDEEPYVEPGPVVLEQELLWLLDRFGLRTVADLDGFIRSASPRAPQIFRELAGLSEERGFVPVGSRESIIVFLLLVLKRADPETVELIEYRDELTFALDTLIGNPVASE